MRASVMGRGNEQGSRRGRVRAIVRVRLPEDRERALLLFRRRLENQVHLELPTGLGSNDQDL